MTEMQLPLLPLGISDFETLRDDGRIYVDKTGLVCELACSKGKYLLARPRRFGKSLLVSTFESLFRNGTRDFKGLEAEKLWTDRTYRVLHLDFSIAASFSTREGFLQQFAVMLEAAAIRGGFEIPERSQNPISNLCLFIAAQPKSSLVLLIDEYDAPLTNHLDEPGLFSEIQECLNTLYASVKALSRSLRFFFMTGITKFSHTGIFSAFNDLIDISLDEKYGALLGCTEDEIRRFFGGYLFRAAAELGISEESLLERLRSSYDGFCFDKKASTHVFCPWSVLRFLDAPGKGFENYWYKSGGQPSVLMKCLAGHGLANPDSFAEFRELPLADLEAVSSIGDMKFEALMTLAGYLTIKETKDDGYAVLGYPNAEVAESIARLYADELLKGKSWIREGGVSVSSVLAAGTLTDAVQLFDQAINAIDCKDFPVTNEAVCRSHIQILLYGAQIRPVAEGHSARGRSDLEFDAGSRHWVLEFKYAKDASETVRKLEEGLAQIRSRRYGVSLSGKKLFRAALVFDGSERRFTAFAQAEEDSPAKEEQA